MYRNRLNPNGGGGGLAPLTPHLLTHGRRLIYVAYLIYACMRISYACSQESCNGGSDACTRIEPQCRGGELAPPTPHLSSHMVAD